MNRDQERTLLEGLLHYLSILYRYRLVIAGITGIAAIGVVAFCVASIKLPSQISPLPNRYTASAIILVQRGAETDLSTAIRTALGIVGSPSDTQAGFDTGAFLIMVLRSRTFLDRIVEEFDMVKKYRIKNNIRTLSRAIVMANLRVDDNHTTGSITISYTDTDPVFAKDVANRMVSLLSDWYSQNMGSSKERQRQLLEKKIEEVKSQIADLEDRQNELQKKYGVLSAQDLGATQASALATLRAQLIFKDIDIRNQSDISTADDPKLQQLKKERQAIADSISSMQRGTPTADSGASPTSLPDVQTEFNNLSVELDVQRKISNTLSHQYEVMKLTADAEPPFQVMELAEIPDQKSGPQRTRIIMEVVAIAFVASIALSFFLNGVSQLRGKKKRAVTKKSD